MGEHTVTRSSSTIETQPLPSLANGEEQGGEVSFSRALLDHIREGVVRFEQDLTIRSGNRAWLTMVGLDTASAGGRDLAEHLETEDLENLRAAMTAFTARQDPVIHGGSPGTSGVAPSRPAKSPELSLTWKALDGRAVDSHTVVFAERQTGGEGEETSAPWLFSALVHDLTVENLAAEERRALKERLSSTQKHESLGILAGGLAHDFNNVLTAILGLVDVTKLQLPKDSPVAPIVQEIANTADYAAILVRNLLAYAGKGRDGSEDIDLSGLTREVAQWGVSRHKTEVELEVSCAVGLPAMSGDPAQIRQVITNLLLNATEALGPGAHDRRPEQSASARRRKPRVRLETGVAYIDTADLQRAVFRTKPRPGTYLFVEVWDNGCGIEPALVPRIFDPFFTTKPTGRGLGLAAVQGIVNSHDGFLMVDTEEGRGTAVRVYFQMASLDDEDSVSLELNSIAPSPSRDSEAARGTILVVDDEEAVRGIAKATLKMAGYEVDLAEDGQEGWDMLQLDAGRYSAVLLDITMPRMTGDELLGHLRTLRPRLPVLLSSGFSSNEACFSTTDDPFTRFLKKPYRTRDLKREIADLIAVAADAP